MDQNWNNLSPKEKLSARFEAWLAAENIPFTNAQARQDYRSRVQRLIDVVRLNKPDRVPVVPRMSFFPALQAGMTCADAMYDYSRIAEACLQYALEFEPDAGPGTAGAGSGKTLEYLDYKLYRWPGHGVSSSTPFQYVEAEYMKAGEYDELINDPSYFLLKKFLGRICGKLGPLQKLPSLFTSVEIGTLYSGLTAFGDSAVQEALNSLMQAGSEAVRWSTAMVNSDRKIAAMGFPSFTGGFTKAPFDTLGDTLRGTIGISMDIYRQPARVLQALERITPLMIEMGIPKIGLGGSPIIMMPLHKGADGFMSDDQFKKFYWPSLKAVILGLIEQGLVPCLFAEGGFNTRLENILDLPSGRCIWYFDQIDMAKAKNTIGKVGCIMGNVPLSLLIGGSQDDVKGYCQNLIDVAGKNGGYIMAARSALDIANPVNLKVMIETAKTYGRY